MGGRCDQRLCGDVLYFHWRYVGDLGNGFLPKYSYHYRTVGAGRHSGKGSRGVTTVLREVSPQNFRFLPGFNFKEIVLYFAAWSVLGLGSIPSQDVFQRVTSANSASTAVRSCFIAAFLYLTVAMLPLFISLAQSSLSQSDGGFANGAAEDGVSPYGLPIQILFFGSLLSAIMSTTSSSILAPAAIFQRTSSGLWPNAPLPTFRCCC